MFAKVSSMKILFVDDMPDTRMLFSIAFETQGHLTHVAADGLEAVEAVRNEPFDAIVMDVEMPRMNGWDATRHIRQMPNGQNVPILIFTGYGEDQCKALEVGANGLVQKPLVPQELLSHLTKLYSEGSAPTA